MPDVLVEVTGAWLGQRKVQFLDAIQTSLVEVLHIPRDDKVLRLIEHTPGNFLVPSSAGARYTRVEIILFVGRSLETKRALYTAIVDHLEPFGVPRADIKIVLIEVPTENVGFRDSAACDLDLGYEIQL
jgi:phenylpyruvate tautomerase PptA (4-oxalocrotonate tautomerase family)